MDTKKKIVITKKNIIVVSLILIVVAIGLVPFLVKRDQDPVNGTDISGYVLGTGVEPGLTQEEIDALLQKKVDESKIAFSIYSEPVFKGRKGKIVFANPRYNAHDIDLKVVVDGKPVIQTEKISPDQYIEEIEMITKPLKKGKHNGVAVIKGYKQKTGELVGEVIVDLEITSE